MLINWGLYFCENIEVLNFTSNEKELNHEISYQLCYNCKNLKKVILSSQIDTLRERCFDGCSSLYDIDLRYITTIYNGCFSGCIALKSFNIPNLFNIRYRAFSYSAIESFKFNQYIKTILDEIFFSAKNLSKVTLLEGITRIEEYAFKNTSLSDITIPSTVESIHPTAFDLTDVKINVVKKNPYFFTSEHCLIDKLNGNLILTFGKLPLIFTIPNEVKKLGDNSIRPCNDSVTIESSILYQKSIGAAVIKISSSVISISQSAFTDVHFLYTVCYDGFVYSNDREFKKPELLRNAFVTDNYIYDEFLKLPTMKQCNEEIPNEMKIRLNVGLTTTEIVLIVVCSLLALILIVTFIVIAICLCKRKKEESSVFQQIL